MGGSIEEAEPARGRRRAGRRPAVRHSALTGIEVDPAVAPSMIDEFPVLFVAAALAEGPHRHQRASTSCASRNPTASPHGRRAHRRRRARRGDARTAWSSTAPAASRCDGGGSRSRHPPRPPHRHEHGRRRPRQPRTASKSTTPRPIATSFPQFEALLDGLRARPHDPAIAPSPPTSIGFAGMACIIFAYAYTTGKAQPNPFVQHGVNLLGAALLTSRCW